MLFVEAPGEKYKIIHLCAWGGGHRLPANCRDLFPFLRMHKVLSVHVYSYTGRVRVLCAPVWVVAIEMQTRFWSALISFLLCGDLTKAGAVIRY